MTDSYLYIIIALLPVAAMMLVFQTNPYHALVIRGVLGAIAALVYSILGAPDVALTEALVGTLLAITLYAVAVRSSLLLTIGVLQDECAIDGENPKIKDIVSSIQSALNPYCVRVELIPYNNSEDLSKALTQQEIHVVVQSNLEKNSDDPEQEGYRVVTRLSRIHEIIQPNLTSSLVLLNSADSMNLEGAKS